MAMGARRTIAAGSVAMSAVLGCGGDASGRQSKGVAESPDAVEQRAVALMGRGDMESAAAMLRSAIDVEPGAAILHARLGYVYRYGGLMDASISAYRRAQALDASPEAMISTEGQIAKSLIYLGDLDGAIASHRRIDGWLDQLAQRPDEKILFYEGVAHLYAGRNGGAVRLFDASYQTDSTTLWSAFGRAYRHAALGDTAQLLAIARSLEVRGDVADGERRYRLAHFFALAGDPARAVHHLAGSIDAGFFNHPYITRDTLLASIRTANGFAAAVGRARVRHLAFEAKHD